MEKSGVVYLALVPLVAPETGVITEVAAIIGKEPYGTRLLLAGKVPKIVAHYEGKQTAESVAQRLRDLGLVPILCTESELYRSSESFIPHTMEVGQGRVLFYDRGGQKREMKSRGVFLIIKGRKETYVTKEKTETTRKFSLARTALTGGIPMWRTEKKQVKESSAVTKYFARLYTRKSSEPAVEIIHNQADYSFLEGEMASSSLANFNIVVTKLQQAFPKAIFDDNLMRASIKQAHGPSGAEDTEINCKLLYLQYLAVKP
jgi:hypothetical protein